MKDYIYNPFMDFIISNGKNAEAVAKACGLTAPSISGYGKGKSFPTGDTIKKLAKELDCSTEKIFKLIKESHQYAETLKEEK